MKVYDKRVVINIGKYTLAKTNYPVLHEDV